MEYYPNSTQLCLKVTSSSSTTSSVTQLDWRRQMCKWIRFMRCIKHDVTEGLGMKSTACHGI